MLVPLEAAASVAGAVSWPRSPPLKICLRATLDTLLVGTRLRPRAFVMRELMALVMAVWIWLLRAEMRRAPMILKITTWVSAVKSSQAGRQYTIIACRKSIDFLRTESTGWDPVQWVGGKNVVVQTCPSQPALASLASARSQPCNCLGRKNSRLGKAYFFT